MNKLIFLVIFSLTTNILNGFRVLYPLFYQINNNSTIKSDNKDTLTHQKEDYENEPARENQLNDDVNESAASTQNNDLNNNQIENSITEKTIIKYCDYSGNRVNIRNFCEFGSYWSTTPTGVNPNSAIIQRAINEINSGKIEEVVFHGEVERYNLITDERLGKMLEITPRSLCYINGSCTGFRLP